MRIGERKELVKAALAGPYLHQPWAGPPEIGKALHAYEGSRNFTDPGIALQRRNISRDFFDDSVNKLVGGKGYNKNYLMHNVSKKQKAGERVGGVVGGLAAGGAGAAIGRFSPGPKFRGRGIMGGILGGLAGWATGGHHMGQKAKRKALENNRKVLGVHSILGGYGVRSKNQLDRIAPLITSRPAPRT